MDATKINYESQTQNNKIALAACLSQSYNLHVETAPESAGAASLHNWRGAMKQVLLTLAVAPVLLCLAVNAPAHAQAALENAYTQPADTVDGIDVGKRISRRSTDFDQDLAPPTRVATAHKCRAGAPCEQHRHIH